MPMGPKGAWRHTELEVIQTIKKLGVADTRQIGKELGLSHKWIEDKTKLLKAAKKIYISDWKKHSNHGPPREVYSIRVSDEEDMPKPAPLSPSQKTQFYRVRIKQKRIDQSWKQL